MTVSSSVGEAEVEESLTMRSVSRIHASINGSSLVSSYVTSRKVPSGFPNLATCSSYSASLRGQQGG
jgi:hypothetical protein